MSTAGLPAHTEITLPLLKVLNRNGGLSAKAAGQAVAEELGLDPAMAETRKRLSTGENCKVWHRRVRWVRQTLVKDGLIASSTFNFWEVTEKGKNLLHNCRPGIILTVFETEAGVALWAEAETAQAHIQDESLDLILTSPPYPLVRPKAYGNHIGEQYLNWLTGLAAAWRPKLKKSGSLVLNLQDVYLPGSPTLQLYQEKLILRLVEELDFSLCQKLLWHSPTKIPTTEWVTVRRIRLKNGYESFLWFGKTPYPKASNLKVLQPYGKTMLRALAQGGDARATRPGDQGHWTPSFTVNHGGSIPSNVLTAHNAASNDAYCRRCRAEGIPIHPGRFADQPVDFLIRFLTDPGDVVYDPMAGSLKVGEVAERLGRHWLASEKSLDYLYGGRNRFAQGIWHGAKPPWNALQ